MAFRGNSKDREAFFAQIQSQNNKPNTAHMIDILKRNDAKAGEELANNLLRSYGISKEDALQMAAQRINPNILKMFGF